MVILDGKKYFDHQNIRLKYQFGSSIFKIDFSINDINYRTAFHVTIQRFLRLTVYTHHILHDGRRGRIHRGDRHVLSHAHHDLKHDFFY
jgi:hypothetical protein